MPKALLKLTIVSSWFIFSIASLLFAINLESINLRGRGFESLLTTSLSRVAVTPYSLYSATPTIVNDIVVSLTKGDGRPLMLDRFFQRFSSPLFGKGGKIVQEADKFGVDWRLLPGIAFQESNLCLKIPRNSYNCWGWAIFTGANSGVAFANYDEAIEKISLGIKKNYYDKGFNNPKEIMTKYTPLSNGSWADGVEFAIDLIEK